MPRRPLAYQTRALAGKPPVAHAFIHVVSKKRKKPHLFCRVRRRRGAEPAHRLMVSDDARFVVTIDVMALPGCDRALTITDQREQAIRTFTVSELLSEEEIAERTEAGRPFRWARGILFDFSLDGTELWLTLGPERRVVIDLTTAAVLW